MDNNENIVPTEEDKALKEEIASWSSSEELEEMVNSGLDKISEDIDNLDSPDKLEEEPEEKEETKSIVL